MIDDIGALVLAGLFLFLSAATLALMVSLRRPRDPLLAALAAFVGIFGTRLAFQTEWCAGLLGGYASLCGFGADWITYVIPLPFLFAVAGLVAGRWRVLARALLFGQASFATVAAGIDLATSRPGSGMRAINAIVAALLCLLVVYALSRRGDWRRALGSPGGRSVALGLACFVPVALVENLRELGSRPGPRGLEALALFVLVSCVAYALALRANHRESAFAALERELELARAIQASVLPASVPDVVGLDVAARFLPLSAVAGDFYDLVPEGERRLAVVVADVTGHGVPAALVASMMKAACASVPEELAQPAQSLGRVNRLLCRMGAEQLITAAWLHVDVSRRRFVYGASGHPPLLVWRAATRAVERLEENGLILGLEPETPYSQIEADLSPGDRLVVYTDGVTEAAGPGAEHFGRQRLEAALAEGAKLGADAFCRQLVERLRAWHGPGPFDDDVTFVVVGMTAEPFGEPPPARSRLPPLLQSEPVPDDAQQGEPSKEEALPSASRQGIGLCLSGGGYRATLFHLGALCRLNELGILTRPDFRSISSVSGGSIAAAGLASAWARGPVSPGEAWDREVRQPIRELTRHDIRTGAIARRLWPWNWLRSSASVEALTKSYEKRLTALRLVDLPERPAFVLCATDMAFGVNWTFARDRMGDYQAGYATPPADFLLARAVAASACFPPVFEPMRLKLAPGALNGGKATGPAAAAARLDVRLTDGGAYDNMGLEPIWKSHAVVLVSDAGGLFTAEADKGFFWRIPRYQAIQETQARSLRKRWLLSSFRSGSLAGTYWGVGSAASRYGGEGGYSKAFARDVIAEIRTDLDAFSDIEAGVLENHGYFLADAAIKRHVPELVPEARSAAAETPPHPAWAPPGAGEAALGEALRGSEKRRLFGRG